MRECFACTSASTSHVWCLWRPQEGARFLGIGVTDRDEPPGGFWELKPGSSARTLDCWHTSPAPICLFWDSYGCVAQATLNLLHSLVSNSWVSSFSFPRAGIVGTSHLDQLCLALYLFLSLYLFICVYLCVCTSKRAHTNSPWHPWGGQRTPWTVRFSLSTVWVQVTKVIRLRVPFWAESYQLFK